jgi:hypothetical protein
MTTPLMVQFNPHVTLDEVIEAVRIVYTRAGCSPCGRLSLFLHAQEVVDPAIERLQKLPSLVNVSELGPQVGLSTTAMR